MQYEAASNTMKGRNVSVLLYLARAWYAYATRESNYSAMAKALSYCQQVSDPCYPPSNTC
jgi:RNA polymerase-associated protein CTR9